MRRAAISGSTSSAAGVSASPAASGGFLHVVAPLIYALTGFVFFYPFAETTVALVGAVCALLGALVAWPLSRTRLRTVVFFVGMLLLGLLAFALRSVLSQSELVARALGPGEALLASNCVCAGLGSLACAGGVRSLALRRRIFSLFEVVFVGAAFAQLVVAHRFGAINRPFELADSIIAEGGDPTGALLLIGGLSALLVVALLLREKSFWRTLLHLSLALLLLSLVVSSTRMLGLPPPPSGASGLGLRPDDKAKDTQNARGQKKPQEGKSDNERLDFRNNYDGEGRQVPLAVVLLHDDYSPPTGLYYFRQTAFSQYNGKRLVSATRADVDTDVAPAFVSQKTELAVVPNANEDRVELDTTVALLAEHTRPFALESAERIEPLQNPDSTRFRRAYRVTSSALASRQTSLIGRNLGDPAWSPSVLAHYTTAPKDPRYAELGAKIVGEMKEEVREDPVARALAVSVWLSREGTYSLKSGHADAEDPTSDFLFGDRVGYCVHFAHAAVYLMRSLGIPARVGAGYVVDEAARQGGSSILITGANSHAWPEFYVEGVGWVIDDVSPATALDPPPPPPDPDLQRLLGEMARGLKPLPQSEDRPLQPILAAARQLRDMLARGSLMLLAATLVFLYLVKIWRRLRPMFAGGALARVAYRAELDRLAEQSLHRARGETREGFARRVAETVPSFGRLTERHLAAAFGAKPDAMDFEELRKLARAVAHELRARVSWWRRWLGALVPWSWLRSR